MFRRSRSKRTRGQALVEFALAATLIFVLLSAAVDLGLMFFTFQALRTAAQEGATYGSHPVMVMNGAEVQAVDLPYNEIVTRVRFSGGQTPTGFANLFDLNNDGTPDDSQPTVINPKSSSSFIYVENLRYDQYNLNATPGTCTTTVPRSQMRNAAQYCYIRVTVSYNYRFIFPLAPVFGDTVRLRASHLMQVRSAFIG